MDQDPINLFERAIIDLVCALVRLQLTKSSPFIPSLNYRRLAYFIIEAIRAEYKRAGLKITLQKVLDKFGIKKDTYYDWQNKWQSFLPDFIKEILF